MKRLLKRTLSLILAMIMVMGVLPMNTMAAMIMGEADGGRVETPVIDRSDPIVDTHAVSVSGGGHERPEIPVDPPEESNEPVDPLWVDLPLDFVIDQQGNFTIKVTANTTTESRGSGPNGFAVVLDRAGPGGLTPQSMIGSVISGDTSSESAMIEALTGTELPTVLYAVGGDTPFNFAADGSYDGEVLTGSLGSFQDFLAEAQKIDPSLSGEIPLRVILVTQAGSAASPAGVSHKVFTWKAGKDAVLQAEGLNGGNGKVPGSGFVQLTPNQKGNVDFDVVPINVIQDATITIMNVVYSGTDEDNITMSWPDGSGSGWPSGMDVNDEDTEGYETLRMTIDQWSSWSHPSGLIEGTITITYVVDGVAGTKTLEIPVTTKQNATKIEITVTRGTTVQGGSTTVTNVVPRPASLVDIDTFNAVKGVLGSSVMVPADFKEKVQSVAGVEWEFIGELPSYEVWETDETWADGTMAGFMPANGTSSFSNLLEVTAASDAPLGTHYVGNLVLPWADGDDDDGEWLNTVGTFSIPVFVEVIEGEAPPEPEYTYNYSLTYNLDGGSGGPSPLIVTATNGPTTATSDSYEFTVSSTAPTKDGYKFLGWADSQGASSAAYTGGSKITLNTTSTSPSASKTIYAVWVEQTTITYNVNWPTATGTIGTGPSAPSANTGDKGRTIDTTAVTLSDTNGQYTFGGWYTEAACTNAAGSAYAANADATLYAKWTPVTHTVTYAAGTTDTVTGMPTTNPVTNILHATSHTIATAEPTRTGYTFTGWKSNVSGDNNNYKKDGTGNQSSITVNDDITLTAQWTINQYTLTYDKGSHGGTDVPAASNHDYNASVNLTATMNDSTESGVHWLFKGWSTTKDDASTKVTSVTMDTNKTVYALWEKDKHTLTYVGGATGVTGVPDAVSDIVCGTSQAIAAGEPTRTGYTFTGWKSNVSGDNTVYKTGTANAAITVNANITLTAQWQINKYTVTYHKGDHGTDANVPAATSHDYNTTAAVDKTMNNSTESGVHWVFKGWSTTLNDTSTKVTQFTNIAENKDVYALWEKDTHTVSYDKNGTGATLHSSHTTATVNCDGSYTISSNAPTWDANHRFTGWNTASNGTGTAYAAGDEIDNITANITLYAQWEAVVTVTWKTGGGTWSGGGSADKTQTGKTGETMTTYTGGTDVTRAGYRFNSWTNNPGTTLPSSDTVYTAQWDRLYNVVFDLNTPTGVTASPTSVTTVTNKIVGEKATNLSSVADSAGNWVFKGWALTNTATSATYTAGGDYTVVAAHASGTDGDNAKITLYGVWVKKTTVTYNTDTGAWATAPSGGTTTSWSGKGEPGVDSYTVPADPAREGYTFAGWLKTGGSSVDTGKTAGKSITYPASDETYTAQWTVKQYTVSFLWNTTAHSHAVTDVYNTTRGNYGAAITAPGTAPSMTGYTFGGWYKEAACTNAMTSADTYPANDDLKMYAKWTANEYEVKYEAGVATGAGIVDGKSPQKFTYDATSINAYTAAEAITGTATGWKFKNWKSSESGTPTYNGGASLNTTNKTAGFTLTAQWQVVVTYAANYPDGVTSGATIPGPVDVDYGGSLTSAQLGTPGDLTDYTFDGWYTAATGGTKVATTTTFTAPTTIYAHWNEKTYSYIFNPNGGAFGTGVANDGTNYKVTGKVGTTITAPADPTRTNYTFQGWAGTKALADAGTVDNTLPATAMPSGVASTEIFAVWKANTYGYVFDPNDGEFSDMETGIQGNGTVRKSGVTGATVTAPTDPTRANYRFDGWFSATTGNDKVTTHTIVGGASYSDGDVTKTVYAHWTPLYDVTYVINGHGTKATGKDVVDHVQYTYTVENPSAVITAGTGESWNGGNTYFSDAGGHWKFLGWKADDTSGTLYAGGQQFTLNRDTVLTAQWEETYKVTLGGAVSAQDSSTPLASANVSYTSASFNSTSLNTGSGGTTFIWVKKGDPVNIASVSLSGANTGGYVFAKWTATASTGAFGSAGANVQATAFTPTADTTLTPNYWLKPTLSGTDYHHLNEPVGGTLPTGKDVLPTGKFPDGTTTNDLPQFRWTQNDATLTTSDEFQIQIGSDWKTPVLGTDVVKTTSGGVVTYQFQRDYLKGLPIGDGQTQASFKVRVKSNTPSGGADTTLESTLIVYVNPEQLTEVNIWAKDEVVGHTASVESDSGRDQVKYKDHKDTKIAAENKLTYTWYVSNSDSAPDQQSYTTTFANRAQSATNAKNAAAAKGTVIVADTPNNYVDVTDVDAYKGKYIYAVVVASGTGYGAVITNHIAVDYDAVIKVQKDNSATITGGNYKVYLVPNGVTPTVSGGALTGTGVVEATYQSGNQYKTADSALTGGTTYKVYVNKVEGNFTTFVDTTLTVKTQTTAAADVVANFYSVNAVDTTVKDAKDSNNANVGETFQDSDKPTTVFTTAGASSSTITVTSGNGVFKGSAVTAKTSKGDFAQDYHVDWGVTTTQPTSGLSYNAEAQQQTKAYAASDGIPVTTSIANKTWVGVQLDQNVYEIKGDIKGAAGKVASATLTYKNGDTTYTFNGNVGNGGPGDTVTFNVPKSGVAAGAITGAYTITATGSTNPNTRVMGYSVPSKDAADQLEPMELQAVSATGTGKFTIFIAASAWTLKVVDDHKQNALLSGADAAASASQTHTTAVTAAANVRSNTANTTAWTKTFANYDTTTDQMEYNVTISNPGNTDLTVALAVTRYARLANGNWSTTGTTIFDGSTALSGNKDSNNVAFANLEASFNLAGKTGTTEDSKTFKVTIPNDLDNDDDVKYAFVFTSKDANNNAIFGPTLTYELPLVVNPIPVQSVGIQDNGDGTYSADALTFNATNTPLDEGATPELKAATDLTYQWYVGTQPTVNATTGVVTGTAATGTGNNTDTYTPTTADGGKTLWLVVKGQNNASQYAMNSLAAPYSAKVTIMEDTNATTDYNSYAVWLVPSGVAAANVTAANLADATWVATNGAVRATHKDADDQGVFTTTAALANGTTYNVWTNVVKGTTDAVYNNSGALGAVTNGVASKTVTYQSVTITETTYDNKYTGLKGTDFFGTGNDGTTAAPQTGNTGLNATAKAGDTAVASGGWVIKGTAVTFTHPVWTRDYTLAWSNATKQGTDAAGGGSTATATINANTTVGGELTLTLYTVTGYAIGNGAAKYVTMTSSGATNANVFTTKTGDPDANAIMALPSSMNTISATSTGQQMAFSVPKGSYAVGTEVASGTTLEGYHATHSAATLESTLTKTITAADSFDVILSSTGVGLVVTDDDATSAHSVGVTWQEGDPLSDSVTHIETLQFGYSAAKDIMLTLTNNSATDSENKKQIVYNIAGGETDTNSSGVTWTSTDLSADGTTTTIASLDEDGAPKVKLTIPTGLTAGTYTYTATFTFAAEAAGGTVGTLNYNLQIVVEPAEFASVSMKYDDGSTMGTVLEAGKDLALNTATTTVNDVFANLTGVTDYHYAWYASADSTIANANLNWNATSGAVTFTGGKSATAIGTVDQKLTAATIADHQSEYIYLMIYATASNGKVIKAAISTPVRAGYQGVVQIKENGTLQTAEPKTGGNAKYTVKIVGDTELATKWDDDAQGYVACDASGNTLYLDPTKTYTVKTSAYEGDTTTTALSGASIKGDDLAHNSHIATAEYFTVTAVETTAQHYVDAVRESFDSMPKAKLTVGTADVDGKTVLKGQNVVAKFATAWTQDYTLTWQDKKDNSADGTSLDDTTWTNDAATAVSTGRTWSNIQTKTYIGGRLDQNTYTITGTIEGSGTVASVVMTDDAGNAHTTVAGGTINKNNSNKISDSTAEGGNNNGTVGDQDDKITLTVVKGTYSLKANAGDATTVIGIKWDTEARVAGDNVTGKAVAADKSFVVYLNAASAGLKVSDTHTTAHEATSNAATTAQNFKHADHTHEVFFSAMTADETLTVNLRNMGNTALTLDTPPTVWKVNAGKTLDDVKWNDWANANPVTEIGTNGAYAETDVITIVNNLTDANKTLAAATANASGVQQDNGGNEDAATITISEKVDVADSGIYILRYTTGDDGPVAYYVLNLVVKQLPIVQVETDNDGSMVGAGDTISAKGYNATNNKSLENVLVDLSGTNTPAATADLTDDDVRFAWVRVNAGTTLAKSNLSVVNDGTNDGTLKSTVGTVVSQSETYTLATGDVGYDFYLVAFAPNYTGNVTNASSMAIAPVVQAKRTVGVKVSLDGGPVAPNGDPGYKIFLVEQGKPLALTVTENEDGTTTFTPGANTWGTEWDNGSDKRYEAPIDTQKTYEIYAVTYLGGTTVLKAIEGTLGGTDTEQTVPYRTVTFTKNLAVESKYDNFAAYLPNGVANSDNAIQDALSVTVSKTKGGSTAGGDKLPATGVTTATPVLQGMNVAVTVDATQSSKNTSGAKNTWSDEDVQPLHTLKANGPWTPSTTTYADTITSNADIAVTTARTFSATLEQVLFDVTFTVVDNTPDETKSEEGYSDPSVEIVQLIPDPAKETAASATFEVDIFGNATTAAGFIDKDGKDEATVTFKGVPKGGFEVLVSKTGNRTKIDGYTWNATGDDLKTPITPGTIVETDTDGDTNKHPGNTIQIQYSSYAVQWQDNFIKLADQADGTVGSAHPSKFYNSTGFRKVDATTPTGPFLALKEGYSDTDSVLTYTLRVENTGAMPLPNFWINPSNANNLTADLTKVTVIRADGTTENDVDVSGSGSGLTLGLLDTVEFTVTIPAGKDASANLYTAGFQVRSGDLKISNDSYNPAYQVKPLIEFEAGKAQVIYGNDHFESDLTQIDKNWTTSAYDPNFTYTVASAEDVEDYLTANPTATLPGNFYTSDGAKVDGADTGTLPQWVSVAQGSGVVSFDNTAGKRATEVNVQVKGTPADFDAYDNDDSYKVDNEIVFLIKAEDQQTGAVYYTTFTVDVEPGDLEIVGGSFTYDLQTEAIGGLSLDKSKFTYTKVVNQINEGVVTEADIAGDDNNTALGNTTDKNGKVNDVNGVHTAAWTVDPEKYVSEVERDYNFTVTYKPDTAAEKWNYRPATYTETIEARKPDMSLKFADAVADATKVVKGDTYTTQDGTDMTGLNDDVPVKLDYVENAKRLGESITYLDLEPTYTVKIQKIGAIYGMELVQDEAVGFQVVGTLPTFTTSDTDVNEDLTLTVKLSELSKGLWVGEHKISFTATGYSTSDTTGEPDVVATYELTLTVDPKVIAEAHVTGPTPPAPGNTPDTNITLTAKDPDGEDIKPNDLDGKGNRPITPKVEWTDKDGNPVDKFEDGKEYTVTIELPADPNYIFEDKDPVDDPEPNYTKDGKTDANDDPDKVDDTLSVTVTPEDPDEPKVKVTFEQTTELPKKSHLEFEDVNADNANDKVPHAVEAARQTITVKKGEALGKYLISLGAYDNTVTDVTVSEVTTTLKDMAGVVWTLEPSSIDVMENVEATPAGDKTTYTLDMTGVDTTKVALGTYVLKLQAVGKDTYGDDVEPATYTITVEVVKATAGLLKFDDVKQDEGTPTAADPATTGPAVNDTRGPIPAKKGDKLGKYEIHLGAYDSFIENVTVTQVSNTLPAEGLKWELTPTGADRLEKDGDKLTYTLDMTEVDTNKLSAGTYTLQLKAEGVDINGDKVEATYTLTIRVSTPGGGGGGEAPCPNQVTFLLGLQGTTNDPVMEMVANNGKVTSVPSVTALEGYQFIGWSASAPTGDLDKDSKRETVDPKTVTVNSDLTFYAVYQKLYDVPKPPFHEHYVIGYPNGNFGPADNINRASVATIIARAVLPNFVEGADYGNPGGYSDVNGHWAASAIAYCSKYGVFNGYTDGTFKPDQSITRQELALVMARLSGVQKAKAMPFADIGDAGEWAVDGIYTAYANGWVNGYIDGTFKPLNPIRRDETVKIFNAYLRRGVDAEGLGALSEYVHTGVASNVTENGTSEYMTWPDVTRDQWAYYEIIEAANDHEFKVDPTVQGGYVVPEIWEKCWIDEKWRYHDDLTDGGPTTGLLAAGFRIWSK